MPETWVTLSPRTVRQRLETACLVIEEAERSHHTAGLLKPNSVRAGEWRTIVGAGRLRLAELLKARSNTMKAQVSFVVAKASQLSR